MSSDPQDQPKIDRKSCLYLRCFLQLALAKARVTHSMDVLPPKSWDFSCSVRARAPLKSVPRHLLSKYVASYDSNYDVFARFTCQKLPCNHGKNASTKHLLLLWAPKTTQTLTLKYVFSASPSSSATPPKTTGFSDPPTVPAFPPCAGRTTPSVILHPTHTVPLNTHFVSLSHTLGWVSECCKDHLYSRWRRRRKKKRRRRRRKRRPTG